MKESFEFKTHYQALECCHICSANKAPGELNFANFGATAKHRELNQRRTTAEYLDSFAGSPPALARLPGFHLDMIVLDYMHIVCLGVAQFLVGNALFELADSGRFGAAWGQLRQLQRWNLQLRLGWFQFKAWCRRNGHQASQHMFTAAMLSMTNSLDWPMFKGKAHNTMVVLMWLAWVTEAERSADDMHQRMRARALHCLAQCWQEMTTHKTLWLSRSTAKMIHVNGRMFLLCYRGLAAEACRKKVARWALKPKFHLLDHCLWQGLQSRRSLASHWAFGDEHYVGVIAKIGKKTHIRTSGRRTLQRHMLRVKLRMNRSAS